MVSSATNREIASSHFALLAMTILERGLNPATHTRASGYPVFLDHWTTRYAGDDSNAYLRFIVGSSATRIDSPSALNASAVSKIAKPGAYICAGAISI